MRQDELTIAEIERLADMARSAPQLTPLVLKERDGDVGVLICATAEQIERMEARGMFVRHTC